MKVGSTVGPRVAHLVTILAVIVQATPLCAQDSVASEHHPPGPEAAGGRWAWTTDANVFVGFNDQQRKFTDFSAWESQNWFGLAGQRALGPGALAIDAMVSLEPFTEQALGSPQVFQTGEAYRGRPLIDYQHPHDSLMGLGATYRALHRGIGYVVGADLVGSPALGPTAFMHRASSRDNPQAPLTHHYMDATHVTPGVVGGGLEVAEVTLEASWFRGEEPDDNRLNIDRPRLDSWSTRASWKRGPWLAQVSGGHLHRPESFEPYDIARLTASIEFTGAIGARALAATMAWGENREIHGLLDGYLLEWDLATTRRGALFGRAEAAAKDLLDLGGAGVPGFVEFHRISHLAAFTLGYVYDVAERPWGRFGVGGDATVYHVPQNMLDYYGAPHSFHVFVRYRPSTAHAHQH